LKISGNDKKVLKVTLKDMLSFIVDGDKYSWAILWLEAIGNLKKPMVDFENEISESEKGLIIAWSSLVDLSKSFSSPSE